MKTFMSDCLCSCLVVAHARDGNFHTIILFDPSQDDQRKEAERLNHFMVHTAVYGRYKQSTSCLWSLLAVTG
jgi:hypothetical protein